MWLVVGSMATALVILGGVLVLIGAQLLTPPLWMLLVVLAATAGAWLLVVAGPVPSLPDARTSTAGVVTPVVIMRAALLEAPAVLGLVLAFVSDPVNLTVYVVPALFAVAGMWLFARPGVVRSRVEQDRYLRQPRSSL
jgi:hypothetical protein